MRDILKPALILLAVCASVTIILAVVFNSTKPLIAERTAADLELAKRQVLAVADSFTEIYRDPAALTLEERHKVTPENLAAWEALKAARISGETLPTITAVYVAKKGGAYAGAVYSLLSRGYDAAGVALTVGVDASGRFSGLKVGDNKETPGLGTKVLDPEGAYLVQYPTLKPEAGLRLVKNKAPGAGADQIDAVTGATITSRAVWRGVEAALEFSRFFDAQGGLK